MTRGEHGSKQLKTITRTLSTTGLNPSRDPPGNADDAAAVTSLADKTALPAE
jgi:hypothetical protein